VSEGGPQWRGRSLLEGMGALGAATFEVARQGTEEQTTAARAILDEARRAMYRLLAGEDDSTDFDAEPSPRVQDIPRVQDTPPVQDDAQDGS
jgi:hypothetical protein